MFSSTDLIILLIWVIVACKLFYLGLVCVSEALGYFVLSFQQLFYHFRNHEILVRFLFFIKTHKTPWPLGRGGKFFPLRSRGFGRSVSYDWT